MTFRWRLMPETKHRVRMSFASWFAHDIPSASTPHRCNVPEMLDVAASTPFVVTTKVLHCDGGDGVNHGGVVLVAEGKQVGSHLSRHLLAIVTASPFRKQLLRTAIQLNP